MSGRKYAYSQPVMINNERSLGNTIADPLHFPAKVVLA
jgi:hypothetical protein